jgi:hypothetical protein
MNRQGPGIVGNRWLRHQARICTKYWRGAQRIRDCHSAAVPLTSNLALCRCVQSSRAQHRSHGCQRPLPSALCCRNAVCVELVSDGRERSAARAFTHDPVDDHPLESRRCSPDSLYRAFTVFGATGWFAPVVEKIKEEWG